MNALLSTLGVIVWNMDPAIFRIGSFELRYYGVLFALALAAGYFTLRWRYRDENEDPETATNFSYALIASVIIGTRLVHCFFYDWERYSANPIEILYFWKGGLASHGAAIGIILTCIIYDYVWRKTPCRVSLDRMAMTIPIAMICVRLGNFFNSEIVGAPCDPESPLAFVFMRYDAVPRYPSQLFEVGMGIIACIVMYGVIYYYKKTKKERPLGLMISLILVLYFGMRFGVEYFKEYQVAANKAVEGLREGQILSIPFFIIGVIGLMMSLFGPWRKQNVLQYNQKYFRPEIKMLNSIEEMNKLYQSSELSYEDLQKSSKLLKSESKKMVMDDSAKEKVKKIRKSVKEIIPESKPEDFDPDAAFGDYIGLVLKLFKASGSKDEESIEKIRKISKSLLPSDQESRE